MYKIYTANATQMPIITRLFCCLFYYFRSNRNRQLESVMHQSHFSRMVISVKRSAHRPHHHPNSDCTKRHRVNSLVRYPIIQAMPRAETITGMVMVSARATIKVKVVISANINCSAIWNLQQVLEVFPSTFVGNFRIFGVFHPKHTHTHTHNLHNILYKVFGC